MVLNLMVWERFRRGRVGGDGGVDPLEFRHADPVKFGELVAGLGPNYEKGCRPTLHKLVGSWSRSPDEPKAGRNQSV